MNCEEIEKIINELKVDSLGRIRNKSKVIDKIHVLYLTKKDNEINDARVKISLLENDYSKGFPVSQIFRGIDDILYKKQL